MAATTSNIENILDVWWEDLTDDDVPPPKARKEKHDGSRTKLYFLGNHPSTEETPNPALYFLASPQNHNLNNSISPEELMYFKISPYFFSAKYSQDAFAEDMINKGKHYVIYSDKDSPKGNVLPFQSKAEFFYGYYSQGLNTELRNIHQLQGMVNIGNICNKKALLDWKAEADHIMKKSELNLKLPLLYAVLKKEFEAEFDFTEPLTWSSLKLEDKFKKRIKLREECLKGFMAAAYNICRDDFVSFEQGQFPPTLLKDMDKDYAAKERLGTLYSPLRTFLDKSINLRNGISVGTRCGINILGAITAYLLAKMYLPKETAVVAATITHTYFLLNSLTATLNISISQKAGDIISGPGLVGTIKELFKKNNYYNDKSRKIF